MTRPARLLAALLASLALAACSDGPTPPVRVFDHAAAGVHEHAPDARPAELLMRGVDDEGWARRLGLASVDDPERMDALRTGSSREGDALVIEAPHGAWARVLPAGGDEVLRLSARVTVTGFGERRDGDARVGLFALSSEAGAAADIDAALVLGGTWAEALGHDALASERSLLLRTPPGTRAIAVVLSAHRPEDAPPARVEFTALELVRPGDDDWRAQLVGHEGPRSQPERPAIGRFSLGLVERPALVLLADERARIPAPAPADCTRLELWGGLVPLEAPAAAASATLVVSVREPGEAWQELVRRRLEVDDSDSARWVELGCAWPAELAGEEVELAFASEGLAPDQAALFASPRLVPASPARVGKNLVLISLDTLRADRVGSYGHERDTTPALDALAARGLRFDDVWAASPYTLPSHASLFSGQQASVHGLHEPGDPLDHARSPYLAETLSELGWATAAFTGGAYLMPNFGFGRGFDRYGVVDPLLEHGSRLHEMLAGSVPGFADDLLEDSSTEAIGAWLEAHQEQSFFLFLHTYAAHEFDPGLEELRALGLPETRLEEDPLSLRLLGPPEAWPEEVPDSAWARMFDLYDGGVLQADALVGRVTAELERLGLGDETLVVVGSDHGKEIGERGMLAHGHSLHEEMLRVPLVFAGPGVPVGVSATPAMTVDVLPTILSLLELPAPRHVQGLDLMREVPTRPLFAEVDHMALQSALRRGAHKTIWSPLDAERAIPNTVEHSQYDLATDPHERAPLAHDAARLEDLLRLRSALRELSRSLASDMGDAAALDASTRAYLDALGYGTGAGE